ncbi:hypothetical protein D3C81_1343760 [compost metagenome]
MLGGKDLIHDRWSDNLEPYRLVEAAEKTLVEHAHVAFTQGHVLFADDAVALERANHGHHIAKQTYLGGHEHRPR